MRYSEVALNGVVKKFDIRADGVALVPALRILVLAVVNSRFLLDVCVISARTL